jgi:multisubunit Na+/H+ antiporter MnhC subunit
LALFVALAASAFLSLVILAILTTSVIHLDLLSIPGLLSHFPVASLIAFAIGKLLVQRKCGPTIQADIITAIVIHTSTSSVLREGNNVMLVIGFLSDFFMGWALYAGVMWKKHSDIR